jgi:TatD family-associated radical SAM protein
VPHIDTIAYRGRGNIYLNITNRCSCDCDFCFRRSGSEVFGVDLALRDEPAVEDITQETERAFLDGPADEVGFCGMGEPTMRLDAVLAVTEWLSTRRIRSRLVTNGHGQLLNPDIAVVPELARVGLKAATVSLNAADPETYDLLCRPIFSKAHRAVIGFARDCVAQGIETTLTAIDLPAADTEGCAAIAAAAGASFRLRPYVPIDNGRATGGIVYEEPDHAPPSTEEA